MSATTQTRQVTLAAIQSAFTDDRERNVRRVSDLVREAASRGAQVILPPELFEGHYFCKDETEAHFDRAYPIDEQPSVRHFQGLAAELSVVIPVSFFERAGQAYYNSVAVIDADGANLGVYRKSHIPDGPGYEEKYFFRPGDTGFRAWSTRWGTLGVGICWDQWFPECARALVIQGAEMLLYPTAIGSEPTAPEADTKDPWQRAMIGHAVCNVVPVVAANRVGDEDGQVFYGSSFIANHRGDKVAEMNRTDEGVTLATFDLAEMRRTRAGFGLFRDRRPDLYGPLLTASGEKAPR